MQHQSDAERARAAAARLLASGQPAGELLRDEGRIAAAVAVSDPDGTLRFWWVPVLAGDRIAGYFLANATVSDWSWSSFQRRPDTLAGCPAAALWLDPEAIRQRALSLAGPGEVASAPRLGFDRVPDRLAWIVRLITPQGDGRDICVAGAAAWPASLADAPLDSTDGGISG